jgi:hypothetical protein
VANERGEGCGFGDAQPNNNALNGGSGNGSKQAPPSPAQAPAPAPPSTTGTAGNAAGGQAAVGQEAAPAKVKGTQFITGPCTSDGDCASACCGFRSGKCAGPVVAQERDGGCGFGNAQPNDDAAKALQGRILGRRGPVYM